MGQKYLKFLFLFRCAKYPNLPPSCTLVPDPKDPTCCKVASCPTPPTSVPPTPGYLIPNPNTPAPPMVTGVAPVPTQPSPQVTPAPQPGVSTLAPQPGVNPTPAPQPKQPGKCSRKEKVHYIINSEPAEFIKWTCPTSIFGTVPIFWGYQVGQPTV